MSKLKSNSIQFGLLLIAVFFISSCGHKKETNELNVEVDTAILEQKIELRLREFERNLKNGDSIALGNMYMENAEILPSTVGRENIIIKFGTYIRNGITGSTFKTTNLWGNDQLLVEEGNGLWYHADGTLVGSGRYLLVWKKDKDEWKILRDTWFPAK